MSIAQVMKGGFPNLTNYQFWYRGILFGNGTAYPVDTVTGLFDGNIRQAPRPTPREHGEAESAQLASFKMLDFSVDIIGEMNSRALADLSTKLMAAISPGYINPQDQNHNFKLPEDNMDKLFFKLPGRDTMFVRARPHPRTMPVTRETIRGVMKSSFRLRCSDPTVYKATKQTRVVDTSQLVSITTTGETYTYPILWVQHTDVEVDTSTGVDRAAIWVRNFGASTEPQLASNPNVTLADGTVVPWREQRDNPELRSEFELRNLNQPNRAGIPAGSVGSDGWATEAYCSTLVYRCDMDAAYRRTPTLIIRRYGTRSASASWGGFNLEQPPINSAPIVKASGDPVNELGKWAVPRKSFYLLPGLNQIANYGNTRLYMEWYDAVLL